MHNYFKSKGMDAEVILLKQTSEAILFYVKKGKGVLYEKYGAYQKQGLYCLFFGSIPLIKFHGDEYMCSTSEKLISAGYGLGSAEENKLFLTELNEKLNAPYTDIETSFISLKPLLGLLKTGYYQLSNEVLFPTDGNGNFFWAVNNIPALNPASAPIWDSDCAIYSTIKPQYLLPSQAPNCLNMERVKHYQKQNNFRAVAYYHSGSYLCTLIDGHHKATAAALEAKPIDTLVISKPQHILYPNDGPRYFQFSHFILTEKEISSSFEESINQDDYTLMSNEKAQAVLSLENVVFDEYKWNEKLLATSIHYYDALTLATIEFAGDLSEKRLHDILIYDQTIYPTIMNYILRALFITKSKIAISYAIAVYKSGLYPESSCDLFLQLSLHPSAEVSDFFLEFLIDDDGSRPCLTKVVDAYFIKNKGPYS